MPIRSRDNGDFDMQGLTWTQCPAKYGNRREYFMAIMRKSAKGKSSWKELSIDR